MLLPTMSVITIDMHQGTMHRSFRFHTHTHTYSNAHTCTHTQGIPSTVTFASLSAVPINLVMPVHTIRVSGLRANMFTCLLECVRVLGNENGTLS